MIAKKRPPACWLQDKEGPGERSAISAEKAHDPRPIGNPFGIVLSQKGYIRSAVSLKLILKAASDQSSGLGRNFKSSQLRLPHKQGSAAARPQF